MSNIDDGGTAFPTETFMVGGMTLRDYFAAKAMQEIMAFKFHRPIEDGMTMLSCAESYAKSAYVMADAMLEARNK